MRIVLIICLIFLPSCGLQAAVWCTDNPTICGMLGGAVDGDEAGPLCLTPKDWPP